MLKGMIDMGDLVTTILGEYVVIFPHGQIERPVCMITIDQLKGDLSKHGYDLKMVKKE